jgi:hypothetical protein
VKIIKGHLEKIGTEANMQDQVLSAMAKKFKQLEKKLVRGILEKNQDVVRSLSQLMELRKEIKELFKREPALRCTDPDAQAALRKVRDDKDIYYILSHQVFPELEEMDLDEHYEEYLVELHGEYDLENCYLRRMKVGSLILDKELPDRIKRLFEEIKDLFCFGLYPGTVVMCRAILETSLKDKVIGKKKVIEVKLAEGDMLYNLVERARLPAATKNFGHAVRKLANKILHQGRISMLENDAFQAIRNTIVFLEELYTH